MRCVVDKRLVFCANGHTYKLVKSLRASIYGEVYAAVVCARNPADPADNGFYETGVHVALKRMDKVSSVARRLSVSCCGRLTHALPYTPHAPLRVAHVSWAGTDQ